MDANALARRLFHQAAEPYRPHLSVVYGELSNEPKQEVIPGLSAFAQQSFQADRVHLVKACSLEPRDWHEISSASLSRANGR